MKLIFFFTSIFFSLFSIDLYTVRILDKIPHPNENNFTQGLFIKDLILYEATGLIGQSVIRTYDLKTKKILSKKYTPGFFGEGITLWNGKLYQLSYTEGWISIYHKKDISLIKKIKSPTKEGWGITTGHRGFWLTDGSEFIYLIDFNTLKIIEKYPVLLNGTPINSLNELEWVHHQLYINVWNEDFILIYDLKKHKVIGKIDALPLIKLEQKRIKKNINNVLNGIAWNDQDNTFYLTGKRWEYIYQVQLKKID